MARTVDAARKIRRSGALVAHMVTEDGEAYTLHFTPETVDIGGIGWSVATIDRQGRKPLVRRASQQARTMSFSHTVGRLDYAERDHRTTTRAVNALMNLADSGRKVRLINVSADIETRGWWYPTLSVSVDERDPEQQVRVATLAWSLTEAIDERPKIGRVPPPPPKKKPPVVKAKTGQPDYVVRKGDSLWRIAAIKLGNGQRWKEIYALNQKRLNLKPAEMYRGLLTVWIVPGMVIRVPAR